MRLLARFVAVAGLVAGGLALPDGAAEAAACSGSSGVTVVIDYGSTNSTRCAAGDPSSAMSALKAVATVVSPQRYPGTVVCRINGVPSEQQDPCQQMPPENAYWAFFHAARGGSWVYSTDGVSSYNPAPGTVIGFAFGSGGAPSSPPPAATATPTPSPSTSQSSSSSTPRPTTPTSASTKPSTGGTRSTSRPTGGSAGTTAPKPTSSKATTSKTPRTSAATGPGKSTTATPTSGTSASTSTTTTAPSEGATTPTGGQLSAGQQPADATTGTGSATTLLAGLGLAGLVAAAAAYLAVRRRAHG